jgi:hypothetical protein
MKQRVGGFTGAQKEPYMRRTMAGGVLGLVLVGCVLVTGGVTHTHQRKDLYIVVGSADLVTPGADGTETTQTEFMVGLNAAADPDAAMHHFTAQLHHTFPPAQGYKNHQIIATRKVPAALLAEVLATQHPPPQRPVQPSL